MDFKTWKHNIINLQINNNLKDNIIDFFKNFHHNDSFSFIKIDDEQLIKAFNNVNNYKPLTICLDIEFQSAITNDTRFIASETIKGEKTAKFIREIGIIFFIKDKDNIFYYLGHIFLNFKQLSKLNFAANDIRLIGAKYSTVTDKTYNKMIEYESVFNIENKLALLFDINNFDNQDKYNNLVKKTKKTLKTNVLFNNFLKENNKQKILEILNNIKNLQNFDEVQKELRYVKKQLGNIKYEIFGKYLNDEYKEQLTKTHELYWNDSLVKKRLKLIKNKYDKFFDIFKSLSHDFVMVVKGRMDIIALKNMNKLVGDKDNINLDNYYDIETFNGFSHNLYKSSQLEETYKGLINSNIYMTSAKGLFDEIKKNIGEKAHNPVVDSLFTIIVAITINLGLNNYFGNIKGGHYSLYKKYKLEYLKLKKNY